MATKKKAAKKKAAKKTAKKSAKKAATKKKATGKKAAKAAKPPTSAALKKYRDKVERRLDKLINDSLHQGEELFGAIDSARNRYTYKWEKMRRRHLSVQMAVWKVRSSRDDVESLMAGINSELKELEDGWKGISREVRKAISLLSK